MESSTPASSVCRRTSRSHSRIFAPSPRYVRPPLPFEPPIADSSTTRRRRGAERRSGVTPLGLLASVLEAMQRREASADASAPPISTFELAMDGRRPAGGHCRPNIRRRARSFRRERWVEA
ncbi:hypothetical protein AB1Y20_017455 [Prymnesium parvum]|uniref:Uncharacterized protein n=1 Tax=Prymnesium parvum TaxID=97485 RepID=A0AB34JNA1_PRYPA